MFDILPQTALLVSTKSGEVLGKSRFDRSAGFLNLALKKCLTNSPLHDQFFFDPICKPFFETCSQFSVKNISINLIIIFSLTIGVYIISKHLSNTGSVVNSNAEKLEHHSPKISLSESEESMKILAKALAKKLEIKKEIRYKFFNKDGVQWTSKLFRKIQPNGKKLEREELYTLTRTGENLVTTTIKNNEGYWEIFRGGLIKLNYRNSLNEQTIQPLQLKELELLDFSNIDRSHFRYTLKKGVNFNGFDCIQITKTRISQNSNRLNPGLQNKLERRIPITSVYYIDNNDYIVGEKKLDSSEQILFESEVDDYEIGDVFKENIFTIDETYIVLEASSLKEHKEILFSLGGFTSVQKIPN